MTPNSSSPDHLQQSRRQFLKSSGGIVAASALAGVTIPYVHAAGSDQVQVALVGCGGRGTGAAANALGTTNLGPIKLVAMADVFEDKMNGSYQSLSKKYADQVDVPKDRQHIGFDGYAKAMDSLKKGDVVILTTPLAFRWVHFQHAIEKGLNVFMEKPLTSDGPTSRKMLELAEQASQKNLKCGVGLMSRHSRALQELHKRIEDGEIGDLVVLRGYRMHGPVGSAFSRKQGSDPKDPQSELLWQIRRFHSFLWASGGCYSDFYIHHIDHLCWMKNAWPVKAQALGGRHYREDFVDQNFDSYAVEYTFEDGSKMYMDGRCINGCNSIYSSYAHGSKGMAIVSKANDCGVPSSTYKGQNPDKANQLWQSTDTSNPYDNEWADLMNAIRNDQPYNEVPRGVQASLTTSLGRIAAHTGVEWRYDDLLNSEHRFAPGIENLTMDSPAFLKADGEGKYPIPMPGVCTKTEYPVQKA
jgi:predicted dehydrogenase